MADRAGSGRIKPGDAESLLVAAVTFLVANVVSGDEEERALLLLRRALPLVGGGTSLAPVVQAAMALTEAGGARNRASGSIDWHRAMMQARQAIAKRAMARAMAAVD